MANPPITIGELANVPAPGSPIASPWAQDVSSRVNQRFANKAALDAWAAPNGARAITLDTNWTWVRIGNVWRIQPGTVMLHKFVETAATSFPGAGIRDLAVVGLVPSALPSWAVAYITATIFFGASSGTVVAAGQIWGNQAAAPLFDTGPNVAPTGAYAPMSLVYAMTLAQGQTADYKLRINCTQTPAAFYAASQTFVLVVAT